jgi:ubiquinone/menaquinone biosynthesis C-methylase UbiE
MSDNEPIDLTNLAARVDLQEAYRVWKQGGEEALLKHFQKMEQTPSTPSDTTSVEKPR